jgi:hypothetical protein
MERTATWFLLRFHDTSETELGDAMAAIGEGAPACSTGHGARQRSCLHDIGEQGVSFYSLFAKQTVHRGLAVAAWSYWSSTMAHNLNWGSLASRSSSKALPWSPQASPWLNCFGRWRIELTRRLSLCANVWGLRNEIHQAHATIYRAFGSIS